jgi:hypothetical protein
MGDSKAEFFPPPGKSTCPRELSVPRRVQGYGIIAPFGSEALEQIGERGAFHEFVLSGNKESEESLEEYYKGERRSPY